MNKQGCKKNKKINIYVIEVGEGEEKEGWVEKVLEEKIAENFPHFSKRQIYRFNKLFKSQIR